MAPDEPKEIMTQEEIDAYIASVRAKEGDKNLEKETQQQTITRKSEDMPSDVDNTGAASQGDIDAMIAQQQQEQKPHASQEEQSGSEGLSQGDIDALIAQQQQEQATQATPVEQRTSGGALQSDIDSMIIEQPEQKPGDSGEHLLQHELDNIFAQHQSESTSDGKKDVWENLNHDILSQDEINALLSGFVGGGSAPSGNIDYSTDHQGKKHPGSVDDITIISRQKHIESQRKKEENIILKKRKASALIRKLLQMEEERISRAVTMKDKMVNGDLYARYEITRSDKTKMIVSMSKKTAEDYRLIHPGSCIYRI
jgi:hypothetical protein